MIRSRSKYFYSIDLKQKKLEAGNVFEKCKKYVEITANDSMPRLPCHPAVTHQTVLTFLVISQVSDRSSTMGIYQNFLIYF